MTHEDPLHHHGRPDGVREPETTGSTLVPQQVPAGAREAQRRTDSPPPPKVVSQPPRIRGRPDRGHGLPPTAFESEGPNAEPFLNDCPERIARLIFDEVAEASTRPTAQNLTPPYLLVPSCWSAFPDT
ncbi:hypothetical protein ACWER6_22985 [Streptomyces sp. NPDC004009]